MKSKNLNWINPIYEILENGQIFSLERKVINGTGGQFIIKKRRLKTRIHKNGYEVVTLTNSFTCKRTCYKIHRLLALSFILNPENKSCINHIDGNKTNNSLNNIEWSTHKENMIHAVKTGLKKPIQHTSSSKIKISDKNKKNNCKPVIKYDLKNNYISEYYSASEAARILNIDSSCITRCCNNKIKYYKNNIWKWKN